MTLFERHLRIRAASLLSCVVVLCVLWSPACTGVTNTTAVQCTSEAECLSKGPDFAGTTCDPVSRTCVQAAENIGSCTKNQECIDRANGAAAICRRSDKRCVTLTTPECPLVLTKPGNSEIADDNVVIVGGMLPGNNLDLAPSFNAAFDLAQFEISNSEFHGLPPIPGQTAARPFAIVYCAEFGAGREGMLRAAHHLADDVQVPLVIGPIAPPDIAVTASTVFFPKKILMVLPQSFSTSLGSLPGNPIAPTPLMWRLAFDDKSAAVVTQHFIQDQLEPALNAKGIDPIKVAIVSSGDLFGVSQQAQNLATLAFNKHADGTPKTAAENQVDGNLRTFNFGDFDDPVGDPNPEALVGKALGGIFAFKPNIILHSYTPTAILRLYFGIEGAWDVATMGAPRPFHIGGNPVWNGLAAIFPFASAQPFRSGRLFAVQNYTDPLGRAPPFPLTSAQVQSWIARVVDRNPELTGAVGLTSQNTWSMYDAVYTAAYAIVALKDKPITGDNLATVLPLLDPPGTPINTFDGPTGGMSTAFTELSAGRGIDLNGLFGNLDFDPATAQPSYGLEITCPKRLPSGFVVGMTGSGYHYSVSGQRSLVTGVDGTDNPATTPLAGCPPLPP